MTTTDPPPAADQLRERFDANESWTVGLEEELMLVDPSSGQLVPSIEHVLGRMGGDTRFQAELREAQVELVTRTCLSAADAGRELAAARIDLAEGSRPGAAPMACVSPCAL